MKRSMKFIAAFLLLPCVATAQVTDSIQQYGRGISFNMKESTVAGAMATSEQISHKTSIDPSNSLYGLIPGLQVLQNGGYAWDDGATLYIRGVGTSNSSTPLILVDGFEREISSLTVQEIESVTVLKDAASLALYGIRGANGVVYIKTKRGAVHAPVINFGYEFNFSTPNRLPDFVDGYTYAQALNEGMKNDGLSPRYSQRELDAFREQTYPEFYPNVNWWDEALRDHAYGNNVNFSISGGGERVQYYAQLNYLNNLGIYQSTEENDGYSTQLKYSKMNIRTNLDIKVSNTTKVKLNLLGVFSENNRPQSDISDVFGALYQVPSGAFPIKTSQDIWGGTTVYSNNPIANIAGSGYLRTQGRTLYADMSINQDLNFLLPGLSATVNVGYDSYGFYREGNVRTYAYQSAVKGWDGAADTYTKLREETDYEFSTYLQTMDTHFNFNTQVNYDRNWGEHKLNAVLLYSMDKKTGRDQNNKYAFMDVVAQGHYTYKNRYILDFALSGSASSVLEPGNRWGIFPSIGAGWILSEEDWLKSDNLNLLKLRASYGIAGRADFDANLYKYYFGSGNSYYFKDTPASQSGMKEYRIAVDGLTYEKSHKLNVGVDLMAWNKLSLTVDGYYDHRTDILVDGSGAISSVFGMTVPKRNDGIINSYGVDVAANWTDHIGDFTYQIGGQFSFARNEIIEMNEEYRPYDYLKRTGHSVGQIFGYEVEGIYQSQEEIDQRDVKQYLSDVRPGDLKFKDQNGDKRIDQYDQVALGYNETCPEIYYGFNVGAEYKGLGFTAYFQGAANYSKILDTKSVYRPLVSNNTISQYYWDNRWSESNPNGTLPRLTTQGSDNNYNTNSLWVADASFLKLRTLEVYYQLPEKWLKNIAFVKGIKIFGRGHDLFCVDGIDIADPESIGVAHPTMRQYAFGFNLKF